jgi:hypothetical protein
MDRRTAEKKTGSSFIFWQRWLFFSSLLFALAGIIFALAPANFLSFEYSRALARLFWNTENLPATTDTFRNFIWGPFGGTFCCAYLLLAYIAWFPFQRRERWARNAIVFCFGSWIILDSVACIRYGVYFQLYLINVVSLLQKLLPLLFTWKDFKKGPA